MSESWQQIQYPARSEPVFVPAALEAAPDYGWYQPASQAVLPESQAHSLGSIAHVNEPSLQVNPVWHPQWQQPISEPVLPVEYLHTIPSLFFVGDPGGFVVIVVPDYGWFRPASEPVYDPEYRYTLPTWFAPDFERIISTDSGVFFEAWVQPTQQPVLPVEYRYSIPSFFEQADADSFFTALNRITTAQARYRATATGRAQYAPQADGLARHAPQAEGVGRYAPTATGKARRG